MRIPLTPHGTRELALFGIPLALLAVAAWCWVHPALAAVPALLLLFVISFFRDPERTCSEPAGAVVAPADGRVADIEEVDEPEVIGGRALRVGIFLSVFDVHVNRVPMQGEIVSVRYVPGSFLDARHPEAGARNEANLVGFRGPFGPFAVRQIAGLIARRIVFPLRTGDRLARGERMGMIKFGSRTELYVPADREPELAVKVGDKVRGAKTVVLRFRTNA